jgi:cytochrome P450
MERKGKTSEDLADLLGGYFKKDEIKFTDVWANAGAVFVAGHDNLSSSIRHTLYELSKRPDLQDRCRKSIQDVLKKHNNELTYEAIMEMTYLEQCIFGKKLFCLENSFY